jgi:hypothetical protein
MVTDLMLKQLADCVEFDNYLFILYLYVIVYDLILLYTDNIYVSQETFMAPQLQIEKLSMFYEASKII